MNALVQFSGGIGSWAAAKRCVAQFGQENVRLLFADTIIEDDDLYRFLIEGAANVSGIERHTVEDLALSALALPPVTKATIQDRKEALAILRIQAMERIPALTWIADGRTPWDVFRDERFIGNSQIDPCSKILKRKLCDKWRAANTSPDSTVAVLGIDWSESHRKDRAAPRFKPWELLAPLCDRPYRMKRDNLGDLARAGIKIPRLYNMGFPHNNCGGFCIKAGFAHFALLWRVLPILYLYHEDEEESLRSYLGRTDISILHSRKGGAKTPVTLREFRKQLEARAGFDQDDWGGCGCFAA